MGKTKYILEDLLSIESFSKLLDQYAEVIEDLRTEKPEKTVHSIVGVVVKHIDDEEIKEKFNDMLCLHDDINEKFGHGVEGMMIDPSNPDHAAAYQEYKEALDHYLMVERPSMELEILILASEKLKDNPTILKGFDGKPIQQPLLKRPLTKYPNELVIAKDKVTNVLFEGKLTIGEPPVKVKTNGKRDIFAIVSIDFDDQSVQISRNLNVYDRQVYEAVTSLYVDGGNDLITPLMIHRVMSGNKYAKMTDNIFNDISESLEICASARVHINAEKEMGEKGWDIKQATFKTNLLHINSVKRTHNGEVNEWIQILQTPILYQYANNKNQVARLPIKLLNTPINKNKEILSVQGYLYREILWMKQGTRNNTISYESIYEFLEVEASTPGALKKRQSTLRKNIREKILDFWVKEEWIKGYKEGKTGRTIDRLIIKL